MRTRAGLKHTKPYMGYEVRACVVAGCMTRPFRNELESALAFYRAMQALETLVDVRVLYRGEDLYVFRTGQKEYINMGKLEELQAAAPKNVLLPFGKPAILVGKKIQFIITGIKKFDKPASGNEPARKQWFIEIACDPTQAERFDEPEKCVITFDATPYRDSVFAGLSELLPFGPVILTKDKAYDIKSVEAEGEVF
jgi:hypothetical protein